jgi:hypothetical protein
MNTYDTIRTSLHFNKFVVGELLFVEYKCPIEQEAAGVWTPSESYSLSLKVLYLLQGSQRIHLAILQGPFQTPRKQRQPAKLDAKQVRIVCAL